MDVELREVRENYIRFVITDAAPQIVNSIRRTLLSDVPKMAVHNVEFHLGPIMGEDGTEYESVTPLFDEMIAHRLGLIPLPTYLDEFNFRSECTCKGEGCPSCTVMYSLNKKGPCTVYSGDMEPLGSDKFRVKDEFIPIVKLGTNQAVLVYATAELGTGKQHAKFQAVQAPGYRYYPSLKFNYDKLDVNKFDVSCCPEKILEKRDSKIAVTDVEKCTLCKACVDAAPKGAVEVKGDDTKFVMQFETDGSLTASQALTKSLELLEKKSGELVTLVSSL
ncbi:MAG: DNA-directed RNA polymerase subunit D [Thermoplasmata archaeon]|nr:DNA-directed RNA polymerase subunit D [Candidatus Sysuiplasma acidicola]